MLSVLIILIISCASTPTFLPDGVTLNKNQMVYRDGPMDIWTHDWQGKHHHYTLKDSSQYFTLTRYFGSQLENAFFGHCNRHSSVELVNISPELITVISALEIDKPTMSNQFPLFEPVSGTPDESMIGRTTGTGVTHQSIQAEQKGDTKK